MGVAYHPFLLHPVRIAFSAFVSLRDSSSFLMTFCVLSRPTIWTCKPRERPWRVGDWSEWEGTSSMSPRSLIGYLALAATTFSSLLCRFFFSLVVIGNLHKACLDFHNVASPSLVGCIRTLARLS